MGSRFRNKVGLAIAAASIGPGWGNGNATAALFLTSGEARYITGTELVVDGVVTLKYRLIP